MMGPFLQKPPPRAQGLWVPLGLCVPYLAGTFALFLVVGKVELVEDLSGLTVFVLLTIIAFAVGYTLRIGSYPREDVLAPEPAIATGWIKASAAYYAIYGGALLLEYGATGPMMVIEAIRNPGSAYLAKFAVYEEQIATGRKNVVIQVTTLLAALYTPLIPFLVLFWAKLSKALRAVSLASIGVYATFFLFIGTLKGLGDLLVFLLAAYLVRTEWPGRGNGRRARRRFMVLAAIALTVFVSYMAFAQSQRLQETGIGSQFPPNPVIASVAGEDFARGMSVVAFYPTHGYVGLAYSLGTPFEWTGGLGGSRALNSYWTQYVGGEGATNTVYPVRTEARTGWPADQYWSTIYPWLASDLTFPGTVLFMGFVGWFLAQFWYEATRKRSLLAVLLFCQLTLMIAFIPANNQIGTSRTSLIAFVCLVVAYIASRIRANGERP